MKTFTDWLKIELADHNYGLCNPPLKSQQAIQFLSNYLLGEDYYVAISQSAEQTNTSIVYDILKKYSPKFREELRKERRRMRINKFKRR